MAPITTTIGDSMERTMLLSDLKSDERAVHNHLGQNNFKLQGLIYDWTAEPIRENCRTPAQTIITTMSLNTT